MERVHDNANALLVKPTWVICQKATLLNFMVMHIRKPENEGTSFKK